MSLFYLIFIILLAGVLAWLVGKAPFIDPEYKAFAKYAILVAVVIYILWALFGGGVHDIRVPTFHR